MLMYFFLPPEFNISSPELVFEAGDTSASATLTAANDADVESVDFFVINFSTSDPAVLQPIDSISINIEDQSGISILEQTFNSLIIGGLGNNYRVHRVRQCLDKSLKTNNN